MAEPQNDIEACNRICQLMAMRIYGETNWAMPDSYAIECAQQVASLPPLEAWTKAKAFIAKLTEGNKKSTQKYEASKTFREGLKIAPIVNASLSEDLPTLIIAPFSWLLRILVPGFIRRSIRYFIINPIAWFFRLLFSPLFWFFRLGPIAFLITLIFRAIDYFWRTTLASLNWTPSSRLNLFTVDVEGLKVYQPFATVSTRTIKLKQLREASVVMSVDPPSYLDGILGLIKQFVKTIPVPLGEIVLYEPGSGKEIARAVAIFPDAKIREMRNALEQLYLAETPYEGQKRLPRLGDLLIYYDLEHWCPDCLENFGKQRQPDEENMPANPTMAGGTTIANMGQG